MKAKLIKDSDGYWLDISDDGITKRPLTDFGQLSIKNCEAIANGYDLDELADEHCNKLYHEGNINWDRYRVHFKLGFQKALEILGDKKFSEEDMRIAYDAGASNIDGDGDPIDDVDMDFEGIIHSAQQTEFDVKVETNQIPADRAPGGWDIFPKLDSDGNLILKRI